MTYDLNSTEMWKSMFQDQAQRAEYAESLLIKKMTPLVCKNCSFSPMIFNKCGSVADPARLILFSCPNCGANYSDFTAVGEW